MSQKSYKRWVMNDGVDPEDGDGGNRIGGHKQNRQENGAGGQVDNQRGRGRGRGFWGRGRRQRDTREDIKIIEWEINFISIFFNICFCSFKGTLMQILKSLYIFVFI